MSNMLCIVQDPGTLFFGPRKHIHDLWLVIRHQKQYIQTLEDMLGIAPATPQDRTSSGHVTTGEVMTSPRLAAF